ncbi:MAG TPA: hypothetical protein VGM10_20920 [Actinocrinis sp.]|jgi:hypothetical protein
MSRRLTTAATASVAALLLGTLLSSCTEATAGAGASPSASASSNSVEAGERNAIKALDTWLAHPDSGTMTVDSVETDAHAATVTSQLLTGPVDIAKGAGSLSGKRTLMHSDHTTQQPVQAIEAGGRLYTLIPQQQASAYPSRSWFVNDLTSAMPTGSPHSLWWEALKALGHVQFDGPSEVGGTSATEYTGTVNVDTLVGVSQLVSGSAVFKEAGTTQIAVDVYTDLGSGKLLRVTYRLGLPVSIDASPTPKSTAGYEVDVYAASAASPSATPSVAPAAHLVVSGGSDDLSQLLLF